MRPAEVFLALNYHAVPFSGDWHALSFRARETLLSGVPRLAKTWAFDTMVMSHEGLVVVRLVLLRYVREHSQ